MKVTSGSANDSSSRGHLCQFGLMSDVALGVNEGCSLLRSWPGLNGWPIYHHISMKMDNKMDQIPQDDAYLAVQPHPLDPLERWPRYAKGQKWGVWPSIYGHETKGNNGYCNIHRLYLLVCPIHLKIWCKRSKLPIHHQTSMNIQICSSIFLQLVLI